MPIIVLFAHGSSPKYVLSFLFPLHPHTIMQLIKIYYGVGCLTIVEELIIDVFMTILQKHLVFVPLFCVAFIGLFGGCVMLLWNWLMPTLFGLPCIGFCQAAGLLLLCKILFGGFGGAHHGHSHCGGNRLRERWARMTPEERERMVEMHKGCTMAAEGDGK